MPSNRLLSLSVPAVSGATLLLLAALAGCGGMAHQVAPPADTVTFPTASTQGWLQQYGAPNQPSSVFQRAGDTAAGIATDASGDVFVLDQTAGSFTTVPASYTPKIAVTKFDSDGHVLWTQQFGTGAGDFPAAIAVDPTGNILVGAVTYGAFPGNTNPNKALQGAVLKLNSSGSLVWAQQFGYTLPTLVNGLATDPQGNVLVGGEIAPPGSAYTNGWQNMEGSFYTEGGFVRKLAAADGSLLWSVANTASTGNYEVNALATDANGDVLATGFFPPASGTNGASVYLVEKLSGASGQLQWQQIPASISYFNSHPAVAFFSVATDAQGDAVLGGDDSSSGYARCAVYKVPASGGSPMWQQEFGAAQGCAAGSVAVDSAGNVALTGGMTLPFFSSQNPPKTDDIFVAKLNAGGSGVWLQQFGTGRDGGGTATYTPVFVATDSQNRIDIAGTTTAAFPNFTNPKNLNQIFVTQFGP
jgi:hypothetical protein